MKTKYKYWWRSCGIHGAKDLLNRIAPIRDEAVRTQVACIAWWDILSEGKDGDDPAFVAMLQGWRNRDVDSAKVERALVGIGYPVELAREKCRHKSGLHERW